MQGEGADVTTIDGGRKGVVVFMADNSILRGFRVTGGGLDWQIAIIRCAIRSADKASFLADSTEIRGKIDKLIEHIETVP